MFYPAYIHTDPDGSSSGFSLMYRVVISRGILLMTLFRMREGRWLRILKRFVSSIKNCPYRVLWRRIWLVIHKTIPAGNGCSSTSI